ncbi:hypothetical protein ACRRTK_006183 [Alexandromys fortis]
MRTASKRYRHEQSHPDFHGGPGHSSECCHHQATTSAAQRKQGLWSLQYVSLIRLDAPWLEA